MTTHYYEVALEVDVEVRDRRLAETPGQAANYSKTTVERAIAEGLARELTGGESSIDATVESVREADDGF